METFTEAVLGPYSRGSVILSSPLAESPAAEAAFTITNNAPERIGSRQQRRRSRRVTWVGDDLTISTAGTATGSHPIDFNDPNLVIHQLNANYSTKTTTTTTASYSSSSSFSSSSTTSSGDGQHKSKMGEGREKGLPAKYIFISFVKGMIGPAVLSLGFVFKQAGLLSGLVLITLFGFVNNYCMLQLVHASQHLSKMANQQPGVEQQSLDYGGVAYEACAHSFPPIRPYRRVARLVVNTAVLALQISIGAINVVFMAVHLQEIFTNEFHAVDLTTVEWILILLLPLILVNFTRTIKAIAILSAFGSLLLLISFGIILQHLLFSESSLHPIKLPLVTDFNSIVTASGTVLYAFEGQAMVLPLERKLRDPKRMVGAGGVLSMGMGTVTMVYLLMGTSAYLTYGEELKGSVTLSLPHRPRFVAVQAMIVLMSFSSYVIQLYVVVDLVWPAVKKRLGQQKDDGDDRGLAKKLSSSGYFNSRRWSLITLLEGAFRVALVLVTVLIASAVPHLEKIIPLLGTLCGTPLALIFPAIIDSLTFLPALLKKDEEEEDGSSRSLALGEVEKGGKFIENSIDWSFFNKHRRLLRACWCICRNSMIVGVGVFGLTVGLAANIRSLAEK